MKKPTSKRPGAVRARAAKTAAVTAPASPLAADAPPAAPKKKINIFQFFSEVRAEGRKITWTSWKETWITSVMVAIMVVLTAAFFFVVDLGLGAAIRGLLNFANPAQ